MKKKILKGLLVSILVVGSFALGGKISVTNNKQIEVTNIIHESTKDFEIEEGETGIIFSNGSWASINELKGYYVFQPVEMGDWSYNCDSLEELEKIINTYIGNNK